MRRPQHTESHLESIVRSRPNKLAKGMTRTFNRHDRSRSKVSDVALALAVKGTTDTLAGRFYYYMKLAQTNPTPCRCCGQLSPKKYILNSAGRNKLRVLRDRRANRIKGGTQS